MKTETFGISTHTHVTYSSENDPNRIKCKIQALDAYRRARENGESRDNPARPFPGDGHYEWVHPHYGSEQYTPMRYREGHADKIWMEEKDHNYLSRLDAERNQQQEIERQREIQRQQEAAIAAAQAALLKAQEEARQAEIARQAAEKKLQQEQEEKLKAEHAAREAEKREQLAKEQREREIAEQQLKSCEEAAKTQQQVLKEKIPRLRDYVSFLGNLNTGAISNGTLTDLEKQVSDLEHSIALKQ